MSARLLTVLVLLHVAPGALAADYRPLPGGVFRSVLPADGKQAPALVAPFQMRATLVSNGEFRDFVASSPEWRRGKVAGVLAGVLAGPAYLSGWRTADDPGELDARAPVTQVSWHAAAAYCASEKARLPRWYEWEYAAAADPIRADARDDPEWLSTILNWYARPANGVPGPLLPGGGGRNRMITA